MKIYQKFFPLFRFIYSTPYKIKSINGLVPVTNDVEKKTDTWYWLIEQSVIDIDFIKSIEYKFNIKDLTLLNDEKLHTDDIAFPILKEKFDKEKEILIDIITSTHYEKFTDFYHDVINKKCTSQTMYSFEADIVDGHKHLETQAAIFDLIDEHNTKETLTFIVEKNNMYWDKVQSKNSHRVFTVGRIKHWNNTYKFSAEITFILGKCSREIELETGKKKYAEAINRQKNPPTCLYENDHIGIITSGANGGSCKGYDDFMSELTDIYADKLCIYTKFIRISNITELIDTIHYFNKCDKWNKYKAIFIIRGGGSNEDLCIYSSDALVQSIIDSKIPIITAIGHSSDELLCQEVADYDCKVPANAGKYIKNLLNVPIKEMKTKSLLNTVNSRVADLLATD